MTRTLGRPRSHPMRPRAGLAATALFLGALALSATTAPLIEPASAQTAASAIDQPTPATVDLARPDHRVAPPRTLKPATDVMATGTTTERTDPARHLPADMRRDR